MGLIIPEFIELKDARSMMKISIGKGIRPVFPLEYVNILPNNSNVKLFIDFEMMYWIGVMRKLMINYGRLKIRKKNA